MKREGTPAAEFDAALLKAALAQGWRESRYRSSAARGAMLGGDPVRHRLHIFGDG
jgi:hypothetical protein